MTPLSPEAEALSRRLAELLGQTPVVEPKQPDAVRVPSRKDPAVFYDVMVGLDGALQCTCPASFRNLKCWHVADVQEEMNMTNQTTRELVPVVVSPSVELLPSSHDLDVVERAAAMAYAGAVSLPAELNTKEKVAAVMLYGLELGLKPMTAIRHLYIVKGKVSPSAEVMAGMCMAKERDIAFHIEELTAQKCTIRMVRPSRNVNEAYTVTWDQITRANLAGGTNANYPEDRLRYHCMKRLMRAYAQDLINNMDEGVVLPGLNEGESWRPTVVDSDFYNEGDAPLNVDRETGEIIEGFEVKHEAQQAPANVSAGTPASPGGVATPAAASVDEPDVDAMRQSIVAMLTDCKQTWPAKDYGDLFRELSIFMADTDAKFDPKVIDTERAAACIAYLRERRGEAVPA